MKAIHPKLTALLKAYTDKLSGTNYREAVAKKCLELVKNICKPATAVKYVVALNMRSFFGTCFGITLINLL